MKQASLRALWKCPTTHVSKPTHISFHHSCIYSFTLLTLFQIVLAFMFTLEQLLQELHLLRMFGQLPSESCTIKILLKWEFIPANFGSSPDMTPQDHDLFWLMVVGIKLAMLLVSSLNYSFIVCRGDTPKPIVVSDFRQILYLCGNINS